MATWSLPTNGDLPSDAGWRCNFLFCMEKGPLQTDDTLNDIAVLLYDFFCGMTVSTFPRIAGGVTPSSSRRVPSPAA